MNDFFRYLTASPEDKDWGIYLTVGGRYESAPQSIYPQKDHPSGYYFDWATGRKLNEYQLNYISEGRGLFETKAGSFQIEAGTLLIIEPGKWHRYKPDQASGWTEYFIGFNGNLAEHFVSSAFAHLNGQPVHYSSDQLETLKTYHEILELVKSQKPGYHQIASSFILRLLGSINAQMKSQNFDELEVEKLVNSAKNYMWEHVHENVDLKLFSKNHSVSYSYFRKMFKLYTGLAPHQFNLDLKIMRAKELLASSNLSIMEITFMLGFDSIYYFSRLFKKKTGFPPSHFKPTKS